MNDKRFTLRGIQPGSAARAAEQDARDSNAFGASRAPTFQVRAGSAAREAEERKRSLASPTSGSAGFSLRAQQGRVDRRLSPDGPEMPVLPPEPSEKLAPPENESMPSGIHSSPSPRSAQAEPPTHSSPGLLQYAAAQLQSRIRAFFRIGASS